MKRSHLVAALILSTSLCAGASAATTPDLTVHIKDFAFVPATATIHPGETIRFVNDDEEPHTVTSQTKLFDSGGLDLHQSWDHTFGSAGTFSYFCEIHPMMHGTVVVK